MEIAPATKLSDSLLKNVGTGLIIWRYKVNVLLSLSNYNFNPMNKTNIETVGYILKRETLASVEFDTDGALVLETLKPYPGYHGITIPDQMNPISMFLLTKGKYSGEEIIRATMAVKKRLTSRFDAAPGHIMVFNTMSPCIRIKETDDYNILEPLIREYKKEGIQFAKAKKIELFSGLIKIRRFFRLAQIGDNILREIDRPFLSFLVIPKNMNWGVFEKITVQIKNNVEYNNFDAALSAFFVSSGIIDAIRIFHESITVEELETLRKKYLQEITRIF